MNSDSPKTTCVAREGENHSPPLGRHSFLYPSTLRNKLVLTFCFFALVALAANIKFIIDVSSEVERISRAPGNETAVLGGNPAQDPRMLDELKNRMLVLLGIMIVSFGSMIFLYVRRVVEPLNALSVQAREMSTGNLSVTAPVARKDDIGELAGVINDLAANFQEILLLTGTTVGNSRSSLEKIEKMLELDKDSPSGRLVQEHIDAVKRDLELLGCIVEDFEFYHAQFDGRKVVPRGSGAKT